jgi:2,4-dienoyl-CoA reductase-like NADH-dependent reductase (Old Yellow Enzyme family)
MWGHSAAFPSSRQALQARVTLRVVKSGRLVALSRIRRRRVKKLISLVTVEMASPEKVGRHRACELGIYDDRFLPGLTRLVDAIHSGGAKASIQLGHAGGHTRADMCGEPPIGPPSSS